jgi:Zn-dependent oligopeptidase
MAEPMPADLVDRMVKAQHFGEALLTRRQLWLANMALPYDSSNGNIDFDAVSRDLYKKYVGGTSPDDLHPEASFDHSASAGYAGAYYTYQWSLAIARDLFTQFDHSDLLNSKIAERYRETILNPGGSEPAAKLVEDFLGRPFNLKANREWLQSD